MKRSKFSLLALVIVVVGLLVAACSPAAATPARPAPTATAVPTGGDTITMIVAPETAECTGVAPMDCLQIKYAPDEEWQLFYGSIENFTFEPGYEYELTVRTETIDNPPADGSSVRWILVEEVKKTEVTDQTADNAALSGTSWILSTIGGDLMIADSGVTLDFGSDGSASGNGSINRYNGSYTLDGEALSFGPLASTRMGGDPALMERETVYLAALEQTASYAIADGILTLYDSVGTVLLTFQAA